MRLMARLRRAAETKGSVGGAQLVAVLARDDVSHPVEAVLHGPMLQGVGKVGLGGWLGDQVDGSSGAWGHGSGGGGDGGSGAVEESDEADGEVAQGGRDQRVRWRCAAGGGPRP